MASWMQVLKSPYAAFTEEKANASWKKALINILVPGIAAAVLFSLLAIAASMIWPPFGFMLALILGAAKLTALDWLVLVVKIVLFWVVWFFFVNLILYAASKLFGGAGGFKSQSYLYSKHYVAFFISFAILLAAFLVWAILLWLFGGLPYLPKILAGVGAVLFFFAYVDLLQYCAYVLYVLLKVEHGFSRGKAIAVLIVLLIVLAVVLWLFGKVMPQPRMTPGLFR